MGSYLSLYNTTPDTWMVKIIPTTWSWTNLTDVVEGIVNRINTELRPTPQLRLATDNAGSTPDSRILVKSGMTAATLQRMAVVAGLPASSSWASVFSVLGSRYMEDHEGCAELRRGNQHTSGRHTLSLSRRGVCYRIRVDPANPGEVTVHLLLMHPIYSGPTDGSKNIYHMQAWINAHALNGAVRIRLDAAGLAATQSAELQQADISVDWRKVFEETRLEEKQKELEAAGINYDVGIVEEHAAPVTTNSE